MKRPIKPSITIFAFVLILTSTLTAAHGIKEGKLYDVPKLAATAPLTIVPGVSVGPIKFNMTKEEVFKALGNPDTIYFGDTRYSMRDKPMAAYYVFRSAGLSILFQWEQMRSISVLSEQYELPGGVRVGMDVSKAEAVLGPLPPDGYGSSDTGDSVAQNLVYIDNDTSYSMPSYLGRFIALKVDVKTNQILTMRLTPEPIFDEMNPIPNIELQVAENDAKRIRATDAKLLVDTGIGLDSYALITVRAELRSLNGTQNPSAPIDIHCYVLKAGHQDQIWAQGAAFIRGIDSFESTPPTVHEIVSRFGLPLSFSMYDEESEAGPPLIMTYGSQTFTIEGMHLSSLTFRSESAYRFEGKIGIGSTMEEVFAVLGRPLKTVAESERKDGDVDPVLYTGNHGGHNTASIHYPIPGFLIQIQEGKVSSLTRYWH